MRRLCVFLALLAVLILGARPARAAADEVQIHLLVMGPGEHLYTRGGHAALVVLELEDGAPVRDTVYNFGDTDWDDPMLVPNFLRGDLTFFLSDTGGLLPTLEEYGVRQGRVVSRQKLNLLPEQAAEVARRLREGTEPGKREYTFHHRHALCSTKIMDLLDDVMGGRLRAELGHSPGPNTGRHYQEMVFSGSLLPSIAGDLFLGRLHDRVLDRYESTASPEIMSEYLQGILVPSPAGGSALVPLAEAPVPLVETTEPVIVEKNALTRVLWGALVALLLGFGASAYRRVKAEPARAAGVVFWAALWSGVVGALILAFIVLSRVPEFRQNELILLFWPADLWLALHVRACLKKRTVPSAWAQRYVLARVAVAGLVVIGHLAGVLYQEPRVLVVLGCAVAAVSYALVRALRALPAIAPAIRTARRERAAVAAEGPKSAAGA